MGFGVSYTVTPPGKPDVGKAVVTTVIDGDTVDLADGRRVRYLFQRYVYVAGVFVNTQLVAQGYATA